MDLPKVNEIIVTEAGGEWVTKSGGLLNVLFKLDYSLVERLLTYDSKELATIPQDIRGLRSYRVKQIPLGAIGANEWHKVRNEVVFAPQGRIKWTCQDAYGGVSEYILDGTQVVFTPHHILHRYESLDNNSSIAVLANTLFDPNDPATQDSYSQEQFTQLQQTQRNLPS